MSSPATLLASVWLAGVIATFCLTVWRRVRFAWLIRRANRVEDPLCEDILASLRRRLRLRGRVRLIVTERLVGPAAFGLLRPTVLLPQAVIEGKLAGELELILAHELIHVRRGDLWFGLLRSLVELVWWFHPLVWWAARRASREAERCCDEAVLAELQCGPGSYARCLLDVLEAKHRLRSAPACPGVRAIEITQGRLERIMRIGKRGYRRTPWWCWAVVISAAAVVVPGAAIGTSDDKAASAPRPVIEAAEAKTEPIKPADAPAVRPHRIGVATKALTAADDKPAIAPDLEDYERMINGKPALRRSAEDRPRDVVRSSRDATRALSRPPRQPVDNKWRVSEPTLAPPRDGSRYSRATSEPLAPAPAIERRRYDLPRDLRYDDYRSRALEEFKDGVQTYEVQDILNTIGRERKLNQQKSVDYLKNLLKSQVQRVSLGDFVAKCDASAASRIKTPPGPGESTNAPLEFNTPSIDILSRRDCFEIETTAAGHRRVVQTLNNLRKRGMGEIKMNVRFLTGSAEEFKKAKLNWVVLSSEPPLNAESNDGGSGTRSSANDFLDDRPGPRVNRVQFVTEKTPPMIYSILADDVAAKLFKLFQANKGMNTLQAPSAIVFNGQSAFVFDSSQTPFVVAYKDGQPQIRVVHEGTILQMRPLAEADARAMPDPGVPNYLLKVDFQVEFSKIDNVETVDLSTKQDGRMATTLISGAAVTRAEGTIQIPEVSKTRVEGSVDLPWNQWLLLGGVEAIKGGKEPTITIVAMRAEKIEPFNVPPKREPQDVPVMPGPVPVQDTYR